MNSASTNSQPQQMSGIPKRPKTKFGLVSRNYLNSLRTTYDEEKILEQLEKRDKFYELDMEIIESASGTLHLPYYFLLQLLSSDESYSLEEFAIRRHPNNDIEHASLRLKFMGKTVNKHKISVRNSFNFEVEFVDVNRSNGKEKV